MSLFPFFLHHSTTFAVFSSDRISSGFFFVFDDIVFVLVTGERTQLKLNNPTYSSTDILISTPGVLSKLLTNKLQNLSAVHTVVIDEADTMVDDSFSDIVRRLMNRIDFQGGGSEEEGTDIRGAQLILVGMARTPLQFIFLIKSNKIFHLITP